MPDLSSLSASISAYQEWFDRHVGPWFGSLLLFAIVRLALEKAASVHWMVGLAVTVLLAAGLWALLVGLRRQSYGQYSARRTWNDEGAILLSVFLFAIALFASISMLVYQFRPQSYSGASSISMGTFTDYYAWLTLDAIPVVHFSDTFQIRRPLDHHGVIPGLCLLAFRLLVLGTLLKATKRWLTSRASSAPTSAAVA